MFIEAPVPRQPGDVARLLSTVFSANSVRCLYFWYYMAGTSIGTLRVSVQQNSNSLQVSVWELAGAQGQQWLQAQAVIPPQTDSFTVSYLKLTEVFYPRKTLSQ